MLNLRNVPVYLALGSVSCLIFSVCYDWGYFLVIGLRFFSMYSLNEHISAALDRLPLFIVLLFPILVINSLLQRWVARRSDFDFLDIAKETEPLIERPKSKIEKFIVNFIMGSTISVFLIISIAVPFGIYLLLLAVVIFSSAVIISIIEIGRGISYRFYFRIVLVFTLITILPSAVGTTNAYRDLNLRYGNQDVILIDGTKITGSVVLRYSVNSILVREPLTAKTRLIFWENVKEVVETRNYEFSSLVCILFGWCNWPLQLSVNGR